MVVFGMMVVTMTVFDIIMHYSKGNRVRLGCFGFFKLLSFSWMPFHINCKVYDMSYFVIPVYLSHASYSKVPFYTVAMF